jgi:mono/diheme cytochrome c family protein
MPKRITLLVWLLVTGLWSMPAWAQAKPRTVLDGVYTEAQAARGQAAYQTNCAMCHRESLEGGAEALSLKGDRFMESWRDDTLEPLFDHMRNRMPRRPGGEPGSLSANTYIDILAYILKVSTFPAGAVELTPDVLGNTLLVGKGGPQPLPTNALVQVLGCLTPGARNVWTLTRASEPVRARNAEETTPEELKAAADKPLGTQTFRLQNLEDFRAGFSPDAYKDRKVLAKGALTRQASVDRIYVLALEAVGPVCSP